MMHCCALAVVALAAYPLPKHNVYNTSAGPLDNGKINVHLVPHTHDDTGWQLTIDQYFDRMVYYVIDTVIDRLLENADRRFIYAEVSCFSRWWERQSANRKALTRTRRGLLGGPVCSTQAGSYQ